MTVDKEIAAQDVVEAAERLRALLPRTPTGRSPRLEAGLRARGVDVAEVWLKYENHHRTGSFKERGALNALLRLSEAERAGGVITSSAGNHAQGLAYHAQRLGIAATVVMPKASPSVKVRGTAAFGAEVVLEGEVFDEAKAHAAELAAARGLTMVPPFDHPDVLCGQGSATIELLEDAPGIDTLVISVGGGGLIAGAALALEAFTKPGAPRIELLAAEPELYPSLTDALGGRAEVAGGPSIAEGAAVKVLGAAPLSVLNGRIRQDDVILCPEAVIEDAIMMLALDAKTVAEGAGALGIAAMLHAPQRFAGRRVGVIVCGGNIDPRLFAQVLARGSEREGRRARYRLRISDQPGRLAAALGVVARGGGNVVDVTHIRHALNVLAKETVIDIEVETAEAGGAAAILAALQAAGFPEAIRVRVRFPFNDAEPA